MKKILLISDTHGHLQNFLTIWEKVAPVDAILHMGDVEGDQEVIRSIAQCPVEFVAGNCDGICQDPWEKVLEVEGHCIFMTHGHHYGVNAGLDKLDAAAEAAGADIVLYGHTHIPDLTWRGDRAFVNPGSLTKPRQEGHHPSCAILEIDKKGEKHFSEIFLKSC